MAKPAKNSGGRERFRVNSRVRILLLTGDVSSEVWIITAPKAEDGAQIKNKDYVRSDRNGHLIVHQENNTKEQKVHYRRILPIDVDGKALVIESNDKYRAVCPGCGCVENVDLITDSINCPKCGKSEVHWLGVKPMTDATTEVNQETPAAETTDTAKPATPKAKKQPKEVIRVDFDALKNLTNCELWTKSHIKFDHPDVDVRAHALLFANGDTSRKLCFNTYDGALGKKSVALPVDEFINDGVVSTGKREKPWFVVNDFEKARTKLTKDGFEQQ